jgi:repressor LexA
MLTNKQRDLLLFIHQRIEEAGVAPSFDEMKQALSLKSKSGIHRLITGLVERGYLQRLPHRARALDVVKLPEGTHTDSKTTPAPLPAGQEEAANTDGLATVPIYGKIAAGTPIEAIRHSGECLDIPQSFLGTQPHYALRVEGDSMTGAGIFDQDLVIIRQREQAEEGRIVVALIDDEEVTLKRIHYDTNGEIVLIPENPAYEQQRFTPERVRIQGELHTLLRNYH